MPITKENSMLWLGDIKSQLGIAPSNLATRIGLTPATLNKAARKTAPELLSQKTVVKIVLYLEQLKEEKPELAERIDTLIAFAESGLADRNWSRRMREERNGETDNPTPKHEIALAASATQRLLEEYHSGLKDIEVRGTAAGSSEGSMRISSDAVEFVRRPPSLATAKSAFAIYVVGDSMAPQHNPGELRFVHPDRPPMVGDSVIIETYNPETTEKEAFIRVFIRKEGNRIICKQHNPEAILEYIVPTGEPPEKTNKFAIRVCKVLTTNELFGY